MTSSSECSWHCPSFYNGKFPIPGNPSLEGKSGWLVSRVEGQLAPDLGVGEGRVKATDAYAKTTASDSCFFHSTLFAPVIHMVTCSCSLFSLHKYSIFCLLF